MPNHVTTVLKASKEVIKGLLIDGKVDFNSVLPSFEDGQGSGISGAVESLAESCLPFDKEQFMAEYKISTILDSDVTKLDDKDFNSFIKMLENKRKHGYLHCMDFNRAVWGTKWNAYDCSVEIDQIKFDTAWNFPAPVVAKLSLIFPNEDVVISYADEDTGSNCGMVTYRNGVVVSQDIAPKWDKQTIEEKKEWVKFAFDVKGYDDSVEDYFKELE